MFSKGGNTFNTHMRTLNTEWGRGPRTSPPSSYSPHTGFSPCATAFTHTAKVLGMPTTFAGSRLVSLATNRPLPCMVTATTQRPAVCPHRFPPTTQNLPHGRLSRRHGTGTFNSKKLTCFLRSLAGQRTASGTFMFANLKAFWVKMSASL